jgi:SAM-dependent methyltransferase
MYMRSTAELREYWQDPDDEVDDPERHLDLHAESEFLVELLAPYVDTDGHVLELGCNVGRNLHYLYRDGFRDLSAIEINGSALELFAEEYPEAYDATRVYCEPFEERLPMMDTDSVDLTFTFAVLAHVHPDLEYVFDEMVRVTDGHVVTFENEHDTSHKQLPRNYQTVFEDRGCRQVEMIDGQTIARRTTQRSTYRARVFRTP